MKKSGRIKKIDVINFLEESNNIEGVFDPDSLKQAMYAWEYIKKVKKISSQDILKLHKILMLNQELRPSEKGYFRRVEVMIAGRLGATWKIVPELTAQWCDIANKPMNDLEIRECHVKFEKIHPFVDGNGRTGRILLNWQRLINKLPILVIKDSEKLTYYKWFE